MTDHTANPEGWIPPLSPEQYAAGREAAAARFAELAEDQARTDAAAERARARINGDSCTARVTAPSEDDEPTDPDPWTIAERPVPVADALAIARAFGDSLDDALARLDDRLGLLATRLAPVSGPLTASTSVTGQPLDVAHTGTPTPGTSPVVSALHDLIYRLEGQADRVDAIARRVSAITAALEV